jgi:2Fe-2S ferredoxin
MAKRTKVEAKLPKITIQPQGIVVDAKSGETVMSAAQAAGFYWPTTCGGEGRCTTCATIVVSGGENLSDVGRSERKTMEAEMGPDAIKRTMRLACQARVSGDVVVVKPGLRRSWTSTPGETASPG